MLSDGHREVLAERLIMDLGAIEKRSSNGAGPRQNNRSAILRLLAIIYNCGWRIQPRHHHCVIVVVNCVVVVVAYLLHLILPISLLLPERSAMLYRLTNLLKIQIFDWILLFDHITSIYVCCLIGPATRQLNPVESILNVLKIIQRYG